MFNDEASQILHDLSRKLILLRTERKSADRKKVIDDILMSEEGELQQLKKLLKLK